MSKRNNFKTVQREKYTKDDLQAIESFKPQEKKFGREVLSVSVSKEIIDWLTDLVKYLNRISKRRISKSEVTFLALTQLKDKKYEDILRDIRSL